jgi:hypothetical protein
MCVLCKLPYVQGWLLSVFGEKRKTHLRLPVRRRAVRRNADKGDCSRVWNNATDSNAAIEDDIVR